MGINQCQVVTLCHNEGLKIGQSAVSKILNYSADNNKSRAPTFSLIHVVYLCRVMGLNISQVLPSTSTTDTTDTTNPISNLTSAGIAQDVHTMVTDPSRIEFKGYISNEPYYCYFFPTISTQHNLLVGTLSFTRNDVKKKCDATLELRHGEKEHDIKRYKGSLIISQPQHTCYCTLSNLEEYGEICMMNFHHRYFLTESGLQCRLASAITTSAGEQRRPTVHRMLITKKKLSEETQELIKAQLLLNSKSIIIAKKC